jgi:hypothetical protein
LPIIFVASFFFPTMISKHFRQALCVTTMAGLSLFGSLISSNAAYALTWGVTPGTQTSINEPIVGGFSFDDELAVNPIMLSSNVMVEGFTFTASDAVISNVPGLGITAIDWLDPSNNLLSFVFAVPLTDAGGNVALDDIASTYTPFESGIPYSITGSVEETVYGVPGPLPLMGAGAAVAWSRKIKTRIALSKGNWKKASKNTAS